MRLTERRIGFYRFLRAALRLSTSQVHRLVFPHATPDAARKWLRQGVSARHLVAYRQNRMSETLFTLGPEGKRILEQHGAKEIRLARKPPKQIEHLSGVNDIRIAGELTGLLSYFFAYWELPGIGWKHAIIPDAIFELDGKTFAAEYDRGLEGVRFFLRTKIAAYERGFEGLPLAALVIITDGKTRMESLVRATAGSRLRIFLSTLEPVRKNNLLAPIFYKHGHKEPVGLA